MYSLVVSRLHQVKPKLTIGVSFIDPILLRGCIQLVQYSKQRHVYCFFIEQSPVGFTLHYCGPGRLPADHTSLGISVPSWWSMLSQTFIIHTHRQTAIRLLCTMIYSFCITLSSLLFWDIRCVLPVIMVNCVTFAVARTSHSFHFFPLHVVHLVTHPSVTPTIPRWYIYRMMLLCLRVKPTEDLRDRCSRLSS